MSAGKAQGRTRVRRAGCTQHFGFPGLGLGRGKGTGRVRDPGQPKTERQPWGRDRGWGESLAVCVERIKEARRGWRWRLLGRGVFMVLWAVWAEPELRPEEAQGAGVSAAFTPEGWAVPTPAPQGPGPGDPLSWAGERGDVGGCPDLLGGREML